VIYVYAITEAPAPELDPGAEGVAGASVAAVEHDGLAAVLSHFAGDEPPASTAESLWAHERVVESLMHDRAVLPARFGMTLGSESELRVVLAARGASLREDLRAVSGCVELGVRVQWDDEGAGGAPQDAVHRPLAALARASTCSPTAGDRLLTSAYLIPADQVRTFAERVVALQGEHAALDISCTGPWPPYSFVGGNG
jgi:hypothetical protein